MSIEDKDGTTNLTNNTNEDRRLKPERYLPWCVLLSFLFIAFFFIRVIREIRGSKLFPLNRETPP